MLDIIQQVAARSIDPVYFILGMGLIYISGFVLLAAVAFKFLEHSLRPQILAMSRSHPVSTTEMMICVLVIFPFWLNSFGQISVTEPLQPVYFGLGCAAVIWSIIWHIWAKRNIRYMWSDGIEIKQKHQLITTGAYFLARHPMYASLFLWCLGASLLMFNWITLALTGLILLPLLIIRAKDEEKELIAVKPDYVLYQRNIRVLTLTLGGWQAVVAKILAIGLFAYCLYIGIGWAEVVLLCSVHLYLGYSLLPEKVAFSYRSKSGMIAALWALSFLWDPFYYFLYVVLAMFIYGLKFNCPCMIVYNKYQRCPCFALLEKCVLKTGSK